MYVVGVSGGSGCGKTTLLHALQERFPAPLVTVISQDDYYKPVDRSRPNHEINFDVPEALDLDRLWEDVMRLTQGNKVAIEEYTFNNQNVNQSKKVFKVPSEILIIEGLFVFHHKGLRKAMDHLVFIDADEHIRFERRLKRDMSERGYSEESIRYKWTHQVESGYRTYLEPYRSLADIVLDSSLSISSGIETISELFKEILSQK